MNMLRRVVSPNFLALASFIGTLFVHSSSGISAEKVNPSGTWRWEYDFQGETIKDSLRINLADDGKVVGTFHGRNTTKEIENGKLDGDKLTFEFEIDFNGTAVELEFAGTVKKDDIDGTVTAIVNGDENEFPWTPKRSVKLEDVFGKWQIRIETPDGNVLEPRVEITKDGDAAKATYFGQSGREIEVEDLKVKDNDLSFTIKTEIDGTDLKADYKGRPYGDKISGSVGYDFGGQTGELDFTAKRSAEKKKK